MSNLNLKRLSALLVCIEEVEGKRRGAPIVVALYDQTWRIMSTP